MAGSRCTAPRRCGRPATRSPPSRPRSPPYYNNAGGECRNYGRVTFTDNGQQISVNFQGWDALNQVAQVEQTDVFSTSAGTLPPRSLPGGP